MKWKVLLWWIIVWAGLLLFFSFYNLFSLMRQEEVQIFLPEWSFIKGIISFPGGFCSVVAQALVQFYPILWLVSFINASIICSVGVLSYLLLQRIASQVYNLFLALIPVIALASVHLNSSYVLDGSIGILLMLLFLQLFLILRSVRLQLILYVTGSFVVFYLIGQLSVLFGLLLIALSAFCKKKNWYYSLILLFLVSIFSYVGFRMGMYIPLTDGIYSERYQMSQLQPDSFVYYIWIRYSVVLLVLFMFAWLIPYIPLKRWGRWILFSVIVVFVLAFAYVSRPSDFDISEQKMEQLSYLEKHEMWDKIILLHEGKTINDYIDLNYLNMALAQSGELGNKMFRYNQKGPQGLLLEWDRTYFASVLLSDIHYMLGDISVSESYAMEGLTLAKRGGSPRMLQRLAEINLIKGDYGVAEKYVSILSRMPLYHCWAENFNTYLYNPEKRSQNSSSMSTKQVSELSDDSLLCLISVDDLWKKHLSEPNFNKITFEYLGCSYLLSKELKRFDSFLDYADSLHISYTLPVHFQEALLTLSLDNPSVLERHRVSADIVQKFKMFQSDARNVKTNNELLLLKQKYGDTFWFYFYYKKL